MLQWHMLSLWKDQLKKKRPPEEKKLDSTNTNNPIDVTPIEETKKPAAKKAETKKQKKQKLRQKKQKLKSLRQKKQKLKSLRQKKHSLDNSFYFKKPALSWFFFVYFKYKYL